MVLSALYLYKPFIVKLYLSIFSFEVICIPVIGVHTVNSSVERTWRRTVIMIPGKSSRYEITIQIINCYNSNDCLRYHLIINGKIIK